MRIWLLALASCWTGPVAPAPVAPVAPTTPVATRPALKPGGYFVSDLISHRLETRAFENVDVLGELAVLATGPAALQPRPIARRGLRLSATELPTLTNVLGVDTRSVVEYCIDVTGRVTSAHVSTQGDARPFVVAATTPLDHDVLESLRGWLFTPYFVDGKPVMACSFVDYAAIAP